MKSTVVNVGNVNLKGRKTKMLRCGCCVAVDLREKERIKEAKAEIDNSLELYHYIDYVGEVDQED